MTVINTPAMGATFCVARTITGGNYYYNYYKRQKQFEKTVFHDNNF
jgi:hypothetical protein